MKITKILAVISICLFEVSVFAEEEASNLVL